MYWLLLLHLLWLLSLHKWNSDKFVYTDNGPAWRGVRAKRSSVKGPIATWLCQRNTPTNQPTQKRVLRQAISRL